MKWDYDKLGNLTDIVNGTTPNSEMSMYWEGSHVWITPTDLGKLTDIYITTSERKLTDAGLASSNLTLVPENAVVMSSRAPIGHLGIAATKLYTNQGCKSFICGPKIDPLFLFYYLKYCMSEIQLLGSGSTFAEVSKSSLEEFKIYFPTLLEDQRDIVNMLKSQFALVENTKRAIGIQLMEVTNLANAIIYESLNESATNNYNLGEVLEEVKYGIGEKWKDYPVYGATRKGIALAKEPPGKNPQRYKPVTPGTVFYNPMRILIGSIAFAEDCVAQGITSPDYVVLKGKEGMVNSRWFYYWLRSPLGQQCINSLARGAVRERMLFNRLAEGHIDLPDFHIQERASNALQNLKPLSSHLNKQLNEIIALPNRLLSNIFQEVKTLN